MSRPLLAIALSLMAGTALGHFLFYEWGYGAWAERAIGYLWGGMLLLALVAFLLNWHQQHRKGWCARENSFGQRTHPERANALDRIPYFLILTILFFLLAGTLRYARFTAQHWPSWVQMKASLKRPINRGNPDEFNYERWLWVQQKRIGPDGWTVIDEPHPSDSLRSRALRLRARFIQRYAQAGLEGDTLALVSAMTLGDRSQVSTATRDLYADAGASHLLALSGLHLGIIIGLLSWLLGGRRLRWSRWRLPAILAILVFVWCFALLAGLPTSLVRAALMSSVFLLAMLLGRDSHSINHLLVAVIVMLLLRPTYLLDVGAQLSVMAVLGIILFYGPFSRWFLQHARPTYIWLKRSHLLGVCQLLLVSFSAQLLTTPLVAHYFHQISPWATLFSLIYIPLTTLLIYGSLLLLIVPAGILAQGISLLVGLQGWFMQTEQRLPLSVIPDFWSAKACPALVVYNTPRCPAVHVIASPSRSWLLVSDSARMQPESGLRYIASSFWAKRLTAPPTLLHGQHSLQAAGWRIAMLDNDQRRPYTAPNGAPHRQAGLQANGTQPSNALSAPPNAISIDVLVIARGFRGHLPAAVGNIKPRLVVLDASLRSWQVEQLEAEAHACGWPVWDIRKRGALYLTTSGPSAPCRPGGR